MKIYYFNLFAYFIIFSTFFKSSRKKINYKYGDEKTNKMKISRFFFKFNFQMIWQFVFYLKTNENILMAFMEYRNASDFIVVPLERAEIVLQICLVGICEWNFLLGHMERKNFFASRGFRIIFYVNCRAYGEEILLIRPLQLT